MILDSSLSSNKLLDLELNVTKDGFTFIIEANGTSFILENTHGEWWLRDIDQHGEIFSKTFRIRKGDKFALLKGIELVLNYLADDDLMVEGVA